MAHSEPEDPFVCTLCNKPFTKPKILPCFHTFCELCLVQYVNKTGGLRKQKFRFLCPVCQRNVFVPEGGVHDFQNNFYIRPTSAQKQNGEVSPAAERQSLSNGHSHSRSSSRASGLHVQLTEILLDVHKITKYLFEEKENTTAYADRVMDNASELKSELIQMRDDVNKLVNEAYEEAMGSLKQSIQNELNHIDEHSAMLKRTRTRADSVEKRAQVAMTESDVTIMLSERDALEEICAQLRNSLPSVLEEKRRFVIEKPEQSVNNLITARTLFGTVVAEDFDSVPSTSNSDR
ncbi:hypothetical protein BaRGS_00024168 [Batillaria attramentaria]|uniref:RING-type domain-containing protein n=1 Tax=Batillaria attramentaria TaxID=370345 RepID=A0ABD0KC39_9CAEN